MADFDTFAKSVKCPIWGLTIIPENTKTIQFRPIKTVLKHHWNDQNGRFRPLFDEIHENGRISAIFVIFLSKSPSNQSIAGLKYPKMT